MKQESPTLDMRLSEVGLRSSKPIQVLDQHWARTWRSEYADLFLISAPKSDAAELREILANVDGLVAAELRAARERGVFKDAYVCLVGMPEHLQSTDFVKESDASRFVSRKYWISTESMLETIFQRLSLLWVEIKPPSPDARAGSTAVKESELRARLLDRKGAGAASRFLEAIL